MNDRPLRIIYLSQIFDPEPTFKGANFVASLIEQGMEVEVVTGFPNYPGGKLFDGYSIRMIERDRSGLVDVTRLAMYPSHDRSALRRMVTYVSFMLTSFVYLTFGARKADVIYVYYPALTAGLAAVAAAKFRRASVILDVQDMWPDSLGSSGMMRNRVLLGLANAVCNLLYRWCSHILVISPGFKALLIARGVPEDKITVVYNWAEEPPLPDHDALPAGFDTTDSFRVLFAGNMGSAQGLETVLEAASYLQESHPQCRFYLLGDGIEGTRLQKLVCKRNLGNVRFLPRVPPGEVQHFLAAADALLVHLMDEPLYRITIPSKTQAYLYAGRPILMGVAGDAADLVRRAGAGYAFVPGDAEDLADRVRALIAAGAELREQMGHNGHEFYMANLRRELALVQTVGVIERFGRRPSVHVPV